MSNLTQRPTNAVADPAGDWGTIDTSTKSLPYVTIGQPMSQGKELGAFNFSNGWPAVKELKNLVIVFPHQSRVLYGASLKSKSRCRSDNYFQPSSMIAEPISDACENCFAQAWDSDLDDAQKAEKRALEKALNKKENASPLCSRSIDLVVVDDRMSPFSIAFQRSQLKVAEQNIINKIRYSGKRPYQVMFDLQIKETNTKGRQFEFVPCNFRNLDDAKQQPYLELFNALKGVGAKNMADQRNSLDAEKEVFEPGDAKEYEEGEIGDFDQGEVPF